MTGKAQTTPSARKGRTTPRGGTRTTVAGRLDVDALLDDRTTEIVVCCGSGGVGKTTSAAALALRAAEKGRTVCVLTIDPARRLAQSMGLTELDNTPRPVKDVDDSAGGSLDAMMLDMKRTFDEVVEQHATPDKAQQILSNPFYVALSSSFAGTQEYMAMEKLGQLHATGRWDLIVVDTPPSRSALDFLDAPDRLSSMLDGRFIKLMLAPAKGPARLLSAGFGIVTSALNKVLGAQVLTDMQTFIAAFDTLFGGFRQRAESTYALLQAEGTAFVVVAAPEPAAMREASYFVERLAAEQMPLAGLVVNRVHENGADGITEADAESAGRRLAAGDETDKMTAELLAIHADRMRVDARESRLKKRFSAAHPAVPTVSVAALAGDVHDLDGLRRIGSLLSGDDQQA
ncbi:AAA family ATPase [Aeromicrobium sp. SMF47]|uniref:ArsA family ATPase n=1 Tax=Aeromicrobium TaxID=2040 RepID=UPI00129E77BF|nr:MULTISPECIES: ArsA-related P-loop ATPase [Aeromicrobium]MRJ75394.1 AAA family ATPase [Aeromicrobium yanjiei]MRK02548.1 AAA family ATPase [Aeromicrobium sp. S22]